ncbi:MAG: hypothetical protein MZV65_20080 [Chromatiales bacterium]|nr:hypothetical protein [Chromatiales bacterium]
MIGCWSGGRCEDDSGGEVLLEVSDAVRDWLIEVLERPVLVRVLGQLDADDLAELVDSGCRRRAGGSFADADRP